MNFSTEIVSPRLVEALLTALFTITAVLSVLVLISMASVLQVDGNLPPHASIVLIVGEHIGVILSLLSAVGGSTLLLLKKTRG